MKRTCPSCHAVTENDAARFCGSCGATLPAVAATSATEEATIVTSSPPPPAPVEALEFTALCPSCGGANPPDTEVCMLCGEEIPQENRRRKTAALGALGAGGAGGFGGGMMAGGAGGGAMQGMAGAGEAMQGLGQAGAAPGFGGLGQAGAGQGMSGLGQAAGQPMSGLGGAGPSAGAPGIGAGGPGIGAPASPGAVPGSMGAPGAPAMPASPGAPPSMGAPGAPPPSNLAPPPSPPGGPVTAPPGQAAVAPPSAPSMPGAGAATEAGRGIGGTIIKTVTTAVGVVGGAVVAGVVLGGILVFTGDPKPCVDRVSTPSNAAAAAVLERWAGFSTAAAAGPATVSYNEQEATSRAVQYLNEKDIPLSNTQVYFCPGGRGQVKGVVNALGRDINILLEGRVDATQNPPVIVIDEIKAGNLPSGIAKTIVGDRLDRNDVKTLNFGVPISAVNVADGQVTVESPGP